MVELKVKNILVTGGAGFIGSHLQEKLLVLYPEANLICVDNFDSYYPRSVKEQNLVKAKQNKRFKLFEGDFTDNEWFVNVFKDIKVDLIVHLAAKAGVRPSISNPVSYSKTNVEGLINVLELAKRNNVLKLIYASSSSVYGKNENVPWQTTDLDLRPISPYAASKISGENFCKVYSELYNIPIVSLRFFTVYGPRQRPDLAIHKFFKRIDEGSAIDMFGD
ncbi:MAG: NAD-dependent epimerase/dehydratase family protein, partial [Saprospiraceae bacterium]